MNKPRLLGALCAVILSVPHTVSATTVWMQEFVSDIGSPINFYLVTGFDDPADVRSGGGVILDFYIDFLSPADPAADINPADLLTTTSNSMFGISDFDIVSALVYRPVPAATNEVFQSSFNPQGISIFTYTDVIGTQAHPSGGGTSIDCFSNGACILAPGYIDVDGSTNFPNAGFLSPAGAIPRTFLPVATNVVPIPAAAWLFGSGLLMLIGVARKKAG